MFLINELCTREGVEALPYNSGFKWYCLEVEWFAEPPVFDTNWGFQRGFEKSMCKKSNQARRVFTPLWLLSWLHGSFATRKNGGKQ